jgi:hypothetical protein
MIGFGAHVDFGTGFGSWDAAITTTSGSGYFDPESYSCRSTYSGTVDGVTGTYGSLTFTGAVTDGSFEFTTPYSAPAKGQQAVVFTRLSLCSGAMDGIPPAYLVEVSISATTSIQSVVSI